MVNQKTLLFGAHMSIAGGLEKSLERGESIGCTAIQIFLKSNRQWASKPLTDHEAELFRNALSQSSVKSVIAHATYLVNLGATDAALSKKSIISLAQELDRCHELTIPYLVLHPGSAVGKAESDTLKQIANNLNEIFSIHKGSTKILLENMAGQGTALCAKFEQLAQLYELSSFKERLGFCLDTCHAFAAGYNFTDQESYANFWKEFDAVVGLEKLKAIHVNDSKKDLGSRVDRHEDIGKGKIGLKAFELLFNDERFFDIPKVLETPKDGDHLADDARNMATIISLISKDTREKLSIPLSQSDNVLSK